MVAAAARVVVGDALVRPSRCLVPIAIKVALGFQRDGNAVETFRRMRDSTGPEHQDQHQSANKGRPAEHNRGHYQARQVMSSQTDALLHSAGRDVRMALTSAGPDWRQTATMALISAAATALR